MALYRYTAVNDDGKEIHGTLDAPGEDAARSALKDMHLEAREVVEATRAKDAPPAPTPKPILTNVFAFEGTDMSGNHKRGTLQADTKYEAFEKLRHDQDLFVSMLSPVGVTPQYRDHDLEHWQKGNTKPVLIPPTAARTIPVARKTIGFSGVAPGTPESIDGSGSTRETPDGSGYAPLVVTIRLYAGWLLAWYGLFVIIGYYVHVRALPWSIPFVEAFYLSPLIFSCTLAVFLFLLGSSLHRAMHGRIVSGILLGALEVVAFVLIRIGIA